MSDEVEQLRAEVERLRAHLPSDAFLDLIERSSLGAEDVREARAHVSRDAAAALVRWADEMVARESAEAQLEALVVDLRELVDKVDRERLEGCRACRDVEFAAKHSHDCGITRQEISADLHAVLDKHTSEG